MKPKEQTDVVELMIELIELQSSRLYLCSFLLVIFSICSVSFWRRFCSPGASTNATRYYLELLRQYLVRNRAELGKLAPHPATSHQRDIEIERFVASGQSLHSYRLTY